MNTDSLYLALVEDDVDDCTLPAKKTLSGHKFVDKNVKTL